MRLAVRVGGGALIGVLFFLIVVTLMPFAIGPGPRAAGAHRPRDPVARRAAREPARARPADRGRSRGRLARPDPDGARAARDWPSRVKALAHWLTTGLPLVVGRAAARPICSISIRQATGAVALTLLAGTPALTFIGLIGAALTVALRRGGLLLAVLVLPLTDPGADLRRGRLQRGDRRPDAVRDPVHDPVCAHADERRARSLCGRRRAAAWYGLS